MALEFASKTIPGTHGPLVYGGPEPRLRRVSYWDIRGEGEIFGQHGGRWISVVLLLHDGWTTLSNFEKARQNLFDLIGRHGTLKETGTLAQTLANVTLESVEPIPLDGQEQPGPIQDVGVLTRLNSSGQEVADNGWFAQYHLRFRQLRT